MLQHALHVLATVLQGVELLLVSFKPTLRNPYRDLFTTDLLTTDLFTTDLFITDLFTTDLFTTDFPLCLKVS
jgi:hypothetical protein